ncbi:cAMP-dependent protein kinase type I-alpha regulatory subunit, partial [Durusdinium trenchii]
DVFFPKTTTREWPSVSILTLLMASYGPVRRRVMQKSRAAALYGALQSLGRISVTVLWPSGRSEIVSLAKDSSLSDLKVFWMLALTSRLLGAGFGEPGISSQKTCCQVLKLPPDFRTEQDLTLLLAVMREVPHFSQLDPVTLKSLCRQMTLQRFAKGDVMVHEGDVGSEFYVLIAGSAGVHRNVDEEPKQRFVDHSAAQAPEAKAAKAKSRLGGRALNRRISQTMDESAMEKAAGVAMEAAEDRRGHRQSTGFQAETRYYGSALSDSDSDELEEVPVRFARPSLRNAESDVTVRSEKSPRKQQLRMAQLLPGSSFGELALDTKLPRQSTVRCEEKCAVAVLRAEVYHKILMNSETSRRSAWMAYARKAPVLRSLDMSSRLHLEPHVRIQQVARGQKVCQMGDPIQEVFFVAEGIFSVSLREGAAGMCAADASRRCLGQEDGEGFIVAMKPKEDLVQKELENLKPLTQVCCGCSLSFGVALILLAYLARSIYVLVVTTGEVVFQEERFESSSSLELQTFHAFTALLGLPFIVSGFYALYAHCDSYLRPFMYFMIVSFVVGALEMVLPLWMNGACAFVPEGLKQTGAAGACGFLRVLFVVFFGQLAAIEAYFIFAVWSLCEDMK